MSRKKSQVRESNIEVLVKLSFNVVGENNSRIISSTSMVKEPLMIIQNLICKTGLLNRYMLVNGEENGFKRSLHADVKSCCL